MMLAEDYSNDSRDNLDEMPQIPRQGDRDPLAEAAHNEPDQEVEAQARHKRAASLSQRLEILREQAEAALVGERWNEAREAAEAWLDLEPEAEWATQIRAQARLMLAGPPVGRTSSGLVIATTENLSWLLSWPQPPAQVWSEKAGMEFCLVPAGEFPMGMSEEEAQRWHEEFGGELDWFLVSTPQHTVHVDSFYMGRTLVTNAQYARFLEVTSHRVPYLDPEDQPWAAPHNWDTSRKTPPVGLAEYPVVMVSWDDAVAYCRWAGLRLPTEAEWEKAAGWDATAGRKRYYPWGEDWDNRRCNCSERLAGRELPTLEDWEAWWDSWHALDPLTRTQDTTPVGTYSPAGDSPYGCVDMACNVWEWCTDWYQGYPGTSSQSDEFGETNRVVRGGSWGCPRLRARCASRSANVPDLRLNSRGFRCCLSPTSSL
jgi:sulfatase modifying factor 1